MENAPLTRRPLATRQTKWANTMAKTLTAWKVRPNTISVFSVFCAAMAGSALLLGVTLEPRFRALCFFTAILGIQSRLLCNLLDGMVAVEGGMKTKTGELYNELPDRIADAIIFICAGYSVAGCPCSAVLGWTTALLAVITAYVRALGASMVAGQQFCGPMAKPHRMAAMSIACALAAVESLLHWREVTMPIALILIILGMLITIVRRLRAISKALEAAK